jgi:hypothetical protein
MRRLFWLFAVVLLPVEAAKSQDAPPPPIKSEEIVAKYCIYANRVYSRGSMICVSPTEPPLTCDLQDDKTALVWLVKNVHTSCSK